MIKEPNRKHGVADADFFRIEGHASEPAAEPARAQLGIGEVASHFGVSLRTLRFYESKGLLKPRRDGKDRSYTPEDRDRLALILKGRKLGFTLTEIGRMIAAQDHHEAGQPSDRATSQHLAISRQRCAEQIAALERRLAEMQEALNELRRIDSALSQESAKLSHQ